LGPYTVGLLQIGTTSVPFAVLVALTLFLRRTLLGVSIRAAAEDFAVVRLMGVPAGRVVVSAFALSGLLAGIAAVLYFASAGSVSPTSGTPPVVAAFIAVVLGGLGNLTGARGGDHSKLTHFFINVTIVVALQAFSGNSGILSFGHMALFGTGAYVAGILTLDPALKATYLPSLPHFLQEANPRWWIALALAAA